MPYPYHFATLTDPQLHQRRILLDHYGLIAQLSILVPFSCILLCRISIKLASRVGFLRSSGNIQESKSGGRGIMKYAKIWRRLKFYKGQVAWWLDSPILPGRPETRLHYLVATTWLLWLLYLSIAETGSGTLPFSPPLPQNLTHTPLPHLLSQRTNTNRLPPPNQTLRSNRLLPTPHPLPTLHQIPPFPDPNTHIPPTYASESLS
jgi:hypothetical protein